MLPLDTAMVDADFFLSELEPEPELGEEFEFELVFIEIEPRPYSDPRYLQRKTKIGTCG